MTNKIKFNMIVCTDINGGIGYKNTLPWKHKQDMLNFKKLTRNNHVIMGKNTFESLKTAF